MVLAPPGRGLQFERQSRLNHFWMHGSSRKAPPYEYQTQRSGHCCSRRCGELWWFVLDLIASMIATAPCPSSHPTERTNRIWSNLVLGFILFHFFGCTLAVDTLNGNSKRKRITAMHWQHSFWSNCNIKLSCRTFVFHSDKSHLIVWSSLNRRGQLFVFGGSDKANEVMGKFSMRMSSPLLKWMPCNIFQFGCVATLRNDTLWSIMKEFV